MATGTGPVIPTGYETLQQDILRKRKLAEAMLGTQMSPNARSPFELLGNLANVWAGKHLEKKADTEEAGLNTQRLSDYQGAVKGLQEALAAPNADVGQIATQASGNPMLANSPIVGALLDAYKSKLTNNQEFGAPTEVRNPDGTIGVKRFSKGDAVSDLPGMSLPHEAKLFNDVAVDPMNVKPGTIFPDVSKEAYLGPDGKPVVNQGLMGAKERVAAAGKPSTSVYVNAMDKSFGKVIPEATVADLTKSRDAALAFKQTAPELARANAMLDRGIISGFGADIKLNTARAADALGITGRDTNQKIARTQTYVQNMGRQILPILAALRPASDTDVKTAQMMAGGDLSLSTGAMKAAIAGAQEAGRTALKTHNERVKSMAGSFGGNPDIANGLQTFAVPDEPSGPAVKVRRIK